MAPAAFTSASPAHAEPAAHALPDAAPRVLKFTDEQKAAPEIEHAELWKGLKSSPKQLPCSFLYDAKGSALYNQITELDEYYPYRAELDMLQEVADEVVAHIPPQSVVVELGCGSATKTAVLEQSLLARDGPDSCTFVGIDVSAEFLGQAKRNLLEACPSLLPDKVELVQATYLEGLRTARAIHPNEVLCVLWLGSSAGNMSPEDSLAFFKDILQISGPNTEVLVCTDLWKDKASLHAAYCDREGVTEAFIKNGCANALAVASGGKAKPNLNAWAYDVVVNDVEKQVEMYLIAGEALTIGKGVAFQKGERILMEVSRKFTTEHLRGLAHNSGLFFQAQWRSRQYSIQMLCSPALAFSLAWRDTDELFARIRDWHVAPIELRHPFCFYYGHVTSFSKMRVLEDEPVTEWDETFSRGIDPDVADPTKCHSHPDAPKVWPSQSELKRDVSMLRQRMQKKLQAGGASIYAVCLSLEHERMHQETLCYMLTQLQKREWERAHLLPGGRIQENGAAYEESLAHWDGGILEHLPKTRVAASQSLENGHSNDNKWLDVPGGKVTLGTHVDGASGFVWDNEGPQQAPLAVAGFKAAPEPVTIAEFRAFVLEGNAYGRADLWEADEFMVMTASKQRCPATWTLTVEGDIWVHYPEGTSHWSEVKERPVWCSLAEAKAFCRVKGCRVMSELEYNLAVGTDSSASRPKMLQNGGWEWTCTPLQPFKGFQPSKQYEEYSADFFDDKHLVLKGCSPYTHPSVHRPSFRNFYQGSYPYMFAKFRCCKPA